MADPQGIAWNPGTDIHLLPDDTWPLRQRLSTVDAAGNITGPVTSLPSGFRVDFTAEFEATPNAQGTKHAHGAKVTRLTGLVSMDKSPPTSFIHNFLVRAELKTNPGNTLVGDPVWIRVHCHGALTSGSRKIWLTPSRLSIHKGADGQAFTVLAAFDDGTIGDISDNGDLEWKSDTTTSVSVDKDTGELAGQAVGTSATITVEHLSWGTAATATTPATVVTDSAPVDVLAAWDAGTTQAPLQATFVAGPGPGKFNDVSNLLFVSEGFTANDRTAFQRLVTKIIHSLETDDRTSPFDILSPQINYWSAFIAAPKPATSTAESGASDVNELFMTRRKQKLFGFPVPSGRMPGSLPLNRWTLNEFIAKVGLPVAAEGLPTTQTEASVTAWIQQRRDDWKTWYGFAPPQNLNEADRKHLRKLIVEWARHADRRLCNERNSALGIAIGLRPEFEAGGSGRAGFHPRRTTRDHLDPFLAKLTSPKAPGIGARWNASSTPKGQDSHLVVALISGSAYGGTETEEVIAVSMEARREVELSEVGGGPEVDHVPYAVPRRPSLDTITTVAHETGHALGLGDEYSRRGSLNPNASVDPLNLQDEKSLRGGNLANPLDGRKLKWLWPRIDKARVLTGKPNPSGISPATPNGKTWELLLAPVGSKPIRQRFKDGDKIRLRSRELSSTLKTSKLLTVSVNGASSAITLIVEAASGTITDSPNDFLAGSIVYTPVFDQGGKDLLLVHEKIQAHITSTRQPLNAPKTPPATRVCDPNRLDGSVQQATNWPPGLTMPSPYRRWQTIGAYEGGRGVACGIYHPAGGCMMGAQILDTSVPEEQQWVLRFCAVCRYILVDLFDPSVHEKVDHWIRRRYPT